MKKIGSIHGRFQPFHNEHLEYAVNAKRKCDFLWIGITQYDISLLLENGSETHRNEVDSNPFTYTERIRMIRDSLLDIGISRDQFEFTPFPIDDPKKLTAFIDKNVICYTTLREEWNKEKIRRLESEGFAVDVLKEDYTTKIISGHRIRNLRNRGDNSWKEMVPDAVFRYISNLNPPS